MRILLDTHVWLFRLLEPARLPPRLRATLAAERHRLYLSPISVWETLVLARKGRLAVEGEISQWVERALAASGTRPAPLTHPIALESEQLPGFAGNDPADRFLLATARVEGLALATLDREMLAYPEVETVITDPR